MHYILNKLKDGSFKEEYLDFSKGGTAEVSVNCGENLSDEVVLRRESLSYLNEMASTQGMKVIDVEGPQLTINVKVKRGDSARVKFLKYPVEIYPDND